MEWISVKDRLPEVFERVLCWDGEYIEIRERIDSNPDNDSFPTFYTYWMSLPKSPKE